MATIKNYKLQHNNTTNDKKKCAANSKSIKSKATAKANDSKPLVIIALSSDDDDYELPNAGQAPTSTSHMRKVAVEEARKKENSLKSRDISSTTTTLIINDSEESESLLSQSSSQHSENYEAEDENEAEMKAKQHRQQQQSSQTLQQVQRFLKSFDVTNKREMDKNIKTLNELRNFRQASPKARKFNISTKFLRKPRNKIKSHQQIGRLATTTSQVNTNFHNKNSINDCHSNTAGSSSSSSSSSSNHNILINNSTSMNISYDESIAKLKDFSIDSLLNH